MNHNTYSPQPNYSEINSLCSWCRKKFESDDMTVEMLLLSDYAAKIYHSDCFRPALEYYHHTMIKSIEQSSSMLVIFKKPARWWSHKNKESFTWL